MNAPKRLKIRQPLNAPADFDITDIIPVFHRWIQEQTVPGLLIDVADYKHVPQGPGILLISDEGDYSLEQEDGGFSIVYDRKRQTGDDLGESIRIVLATLRTALQALEAEPSLALSAEASHIELTILDRLQYPNTLEIFDVIRNSLTESVAAIYELPHVQLSYTTTDARRPLTIQIQTEHELAIA